MYIPQHFEERDSARIEKLIGDHGFGLLVTSDAGRPFSSHIPFLYEPNRLLCHLARANPQVGHLASGDEVSAIFSGPHAYVSPSWYESPGVPTWNYAAVHVYGKPKAMTDGKQLQDLVERMTRYYEAGEIEPWEPSFDLTMLDSIVGFEIIVTEIHGKFKLSQNRPAIDRTNVIRRLRDKGSDNSVGTAALMQELSR